MMPINWKKPLQTRDGRKVQDRGSMQDGKYRLIIVTEPNGEQNGKTVHASGHLRDDCKPHPLDVINVPPKPVAQPQRDIMVRPKLILRIGGQNITLVGDKLITKAESMVLSSPMSVRMRIVGAGYEVDGPRTPGYPGH